MVNKNNKIESHTSNRKIFASMFVVLALFFAVSAFTLFGQISSQAKVQIQDQSQFQNIAKQLVNPHLSQEEEKSAINTLKNLKPEEMVLVRKLWRDQLLNDNRLTKSQAKIFPKLEEFDKYFYQKIEERFGKGKNIFNMPPEQIGKLFDELKNDDFIVKSLISDIENANISSQQSNLWGIQLASAAGGNCDYVASWPTWTNAVHRSYYYYRSYAVDRVKNDPNENPCDFRLYITPRNYSEVDGRTLAGWCVAQFHGGLSGSASKDRYIVGYGSALVCLVPFDWYLRDYITFRT